jgi:hypothetical protein
MDNIALIGAAGAIGQSVARAVSHEQGDVHAAGDVALEDEVTHVPAPRRQALTLTLFEAAPAHDGPPGVTGEHQPARFHLVVELHHANESPEPADELTRQDDNRQYPPRLPNRQQDNGVVEDPLPRGVSGDRLVLRVKSAHRRSSAARSALMSGVEQTVTPAFANVAFADGCAPVSAVRDSRTEIAVSCGPGPFGRDRVPSLPRRSSL